MAEYKHGAYGETNMNGSRVAVEAQTAFVIVGTAPVGQLPAPWNVNTPVVVSNIAEAKRAFGYSDDWEKYTLCEAFHVFFEQRGYGPLVVINVLDPATHKSGTAATKTATAVNGQLTFTEAADIILDTVELTPAGESDPLVKDTDYTIFYSTATGSIIATELTAGVFGTGTVTASYKTMDASAVTAATVIGSSSGTGLNTGLYAVKNVYQLTGFVPNFLLVPGFSSVKTVHDAMAEVSVKVNGHWDLFMYADLPLLNGSTPLTMDTIAAYKEANGYNRENEKVFFPMGLGVDEKKYHLSVLAAAALLEVTAENDDIPYHGSSNQAVEVLSNIWLGADYTGYVFDDSIINEKLNKNGICSACYNGGRWVIWGAHCADYNPTTKSYVNVSETNRLMMYYISNDFQARRPADVDQPLSPNDIASIVSDEQARLDALIQIGALTYGVAYIDASADTKSDMMNGDYCFSFDITTTPLAKSLTAVVSWVDDGFATYFSQGE